MPRAILIALLLALAVPAQAGPSPWIGAKACGSCHTAELARWSEGPHARAANSLGTRAGQGRCESCHGTAAGQGGTRPLKHVQCEACHGAGRHYAEDDIMRNPVLSRALGLRSLDSEEARERLCMRCHQSSTSLRVFEVEKAWKQIRH